MEKTSDFHLDLEHWIHQLAEMPYRLGGILSFLAIFVFYIIAAEWSYMFVLSPGSNAVFWLPSGITAALFIRARWTPKIWPYWLLALLVGQFYVVSSHQAPLQTTFFWSLANISLPLLVALNSRKMSRDTLDFKSVRDVFRWLGIISFAVLPSSLIAAIGTVLGFEEANYFRAAFSWFTSDLLGMILFSPLILSFASRPSPREGSLKEGALLFILMITTALCILKLSHLEFLSRSFFSILILYVAWGALRFGPRGTSVLLIIFDMIEIYATIKGSGTFANIDLSTGERLFIIQVLVANLGILMLILAAAIEEQKLARLEAEAAIKMRDDFISVASHELKTPISSIFMEVQMINRYMKKGEWNTLPKDKVKSLAKTIEHQLLKLSRLVNDLLDVSRINTGRFDLHLEDLNLATILDETIDQFRADIEEKGIQLTVMKDPTVIGKWDKIRLQQAFTNLISNAIKYGKGSPINVTVEKNHRCGRVFISDKGPGIPLEHQGRIFERFERANSSHSEKGLGLGLFIVKEIIEAHKGRISLRSRVGEGSTFIVEIPR